MSPSDTNTQAIDEKTIPSHSQLIKAVVISAAVAALLLVTIILPAEYGIDPTGTGKLMGLTGINEASASGETEQAAAPAASVRSALSNTPIAYRNDVTTVILPPGKGLEVKASMDEGQLMVFDWSTDGGAVNLDMHGEPPNAGNEFTSHRKGSDETGNRGSFIAPFSGTHGWWWANRSETPITVTLKTAGFYHSIAQR